MDQRFDFYGRHLLLNFSGCQADLDDLEQIERDMFRAVNSVGATILAHLAHKFEPCGVSVVLMLSESHASVHTYPEYNACFLDIFTCGEQIRVEPFGEILEKLWQPQWVSHQLQERFDPLIKQPSQLPLSINQRAVVPLNKG